MPSVGHTGTCFDDDATESFNATLREGLINLRVQAELKAVERAVFECVEAYCNRKRIQRRLDYLTPCEYESSIDIGMASTAYFTCLRKR